MDKNESRAYSRGYQAGKKSRAAEIESMSRQLLKAKEDKFDKYFCAALTGLLSSKSGWKMNDNDVNDSKSHVKLAKIFAKEAVKENA